MNYRFFIVFLFSLAACQQWETKKIQSSEIVKEEIENMDFKEVDQYPSFEGCDELASKTSRKECFENKLIETIYSVINAKNIVVSQTLDDTLWLQLAISEKGKISLDTTVITGTVEWEIPELREWLQNSMDSLPKSYPALKRGIPVRSTYKLPLVLSVE